MKLSAKRELSTERDPLLSGDEIETRTRGAVKKKTLNYWRCVGRYASELPYIKVGRSVYYRQSTIENFLKERSRGS